MLLLRADPSQGPEKALRLLDQIVDKFGDKPELRLDRVDCLIVLNEKEPQQGTTPEARIRGIEQSPPIGRRTTRSPSGTAWPAAI